MIVVFFGFLAAAVFAGRVNTGLSRVEAAARSSARTISIARDPEGAFTVAETQASQMVSEGSPICVDMDFVPDIDPATDPAVITVDITCEADVSQLSLIGVGPTYSFTVSAEEVLDRYREDP